MPTPQPTTFPNWRLYPSPVDDAYLMGRWDGETGVAWNGQTGVGWQPSIGQRWPEGTGSRWL